MNATHDDILFGPHKTPEVNVTQARMFKNGEVKILIENFEPRYMPVYAGAIGGVD